MLKNYNDPISNSVLLDPELEQIYNETNDGEFLGIVVDPNDPLFEGRCKVRVFEKFDGIEDEDLPWAYPENTYIFSGGDGGSGNFSYPKKGHLVTVTFESSDIYHPIYKSVEGLNNSLKKEISQSYIDSQVLVYDEGEDLKIIYTKSKGLFVWLKGSYVNIMPTNDILINHVGGTSKILLSGSNISNTCDKELYTKSPYTKIDTQDCRLGHAAEHPVPKGDDLMTLLLKMAVAIDAKIPTAVPYSVTAEVLASSVLSKTVFVAD